MRRKLLIAVTVFLGILIFMQFTGCLRLYDPPRKGKIIDADTGEPVEDVVVMGHWKIEYLHHLPLRLLPLGPVVTFYYDAQETVTDENGHYTLPGLGLWLYPGHLKRPSIRSYKKGYELIRFRWKTKRIIELKTTYSPTYERLGLEWKKDGLYIPLRKLDPEESLGRINIPSSIERNKIQRFLQEIDHHSLMSPGLRPGEKLLPALGGSERLK